MAVLQLPLSATIQALLGADLGEPGSLNAALAAIPPVAVRVAVPNAAEPNAASQRRCSRDCANCPMKTTSIADDAS